MTESSKYFIEHFKINKVQCRTFINDSKLNAKLEGIQSAIDEGLLRVKVVVCGSVRVSATNKLTEQY